MKLDFDYYYGSESTQYSYYRIPKALISNSYFSRLSTDAKLLYGLILDRMSLSMKNNWFDDENKVFIFFSIEYITTLMNCGRDKAMKLLAELDTKKGIGLIERVRQGQGKTDRIYIKNFSRINQPPVVDYYDQQKSENPTPRSRETRLPEVEESDYQKSEIPTSKSRETPPLEVEIFDPNNIKINDLDSNELNLPILQSNNGMERIDELREEIKRRIDYSILLEQYAAETLDELIELILEVELSTSQTYSISGTRLNMDYVKSRFHKISRFHIDYAMTSLKGSTVRVHNIKAFLLTTLFNSTSTMENYYQQEVNHYLYREQNE